MRAATGEADAHIPKPGLLLLVHAEVVGLGVGGEIKFMVALKSSSGQLLQLRQDFVHAPVGHEEFEARAIAFLAIAEVAEHDG